MIDHDIVITVHALHRMEQRLCGDGKNRRKFAKGNVANAIAHLAQRHRDVPTLPDAARVSVGDWVWVIGQDEAGAVHLITVYRFEPTRSPRRRRQKRRERQ